MTNTEKILEDKKDHIAYSPEVNLIRPILAKYMNEWSADMLGELAKILTESIAQALAEERERVSGYIENAIKYTNWTHSVGSHSDDRGGDSDIECTCREDEVRYKTEAYKHILSFLASLDKPLLEILLDY